VILQDASSRTSMILCKLQSVLFCLYSEVGLCSILKGTGTRLLNWSKEAWLERPLLGEGHNLLLLLY
jgi:hypothetical protein